LISASLSVFYTHIDPFEDHLLFLLCDFFSFLGANNSYPQVEEIKIKKYAISHFYVDIRIFDVEIHILDIENPKKSKYRLTLPRVMAAVSRHV
jgi:hypothetical protein